MRSAGDSSRILVVGLKTEAQPVLADLRAVGHEVSLVEDLKEARLLLESRGFDQAILPGRELSTLLEQRFLWEGLDTDAWRRSTSAIAHDLRSLLLALHHAIESLQTTTAEKQATFGGDLDEIERTVLTLSSFLRELTVELDAPVNGEPALSDVDLEDAVETAAMAVYPTASERHQRLVIDIDEAARHVRADSTKLKRVLTSLLQYASRYAPSLGTVTVRAYQELGDCVITVSQTGDGSAESELRRLFGPTSEKKGANGAPLARVRRLVEQQGGRVWIERQAGSGTSVFVSLPHQ